MRRLLIALVVAVGLLSLTVPAEARWGCGWGGYRGCGYGGWGGCYRGGYCGYGGYGGYCGYRPYYSVGYFPAYGGYGYGSPYSYGGFGYPYSYGGYGYGYNAPLSIGYYSLGSYNPSANFVVAAAPAVAQPAKGNFGPQAVQQFLGITNLRPIAVNASKPTINVVDRPLTLSNPESRRKAERYIVEGDALFRVQNFNSALQKYKLAAATAPDVAESYWRQGHALVAVKQFDLATSAFKRAIGLTDELSRGGFKLDDLYAGALLTKTAHLESLAELAMTRSNSSDPYFLLGLFLTYDGQQERATKFFERAADLAGISGGHIAVFLVPAKAAETAAAPVVPVVQVSVGTEI